MKKRIILFVILIFVFSFVGIFIMVSIDKKTLNKIEKSISDNTDINNIKYVNKYDEHYIVIDNKYLYLFDSEYLEVTKLDISLISKNKNNYDIVYKDKTIMYMNDYMKNGELVFEYYDIYTYEILNKIVVGGN